jgi:hypothetical protein
MLGFIERTSSYTNEPSIVLKGANTVGRAHQLLPYSVTGKCLPASHHIPYGIRQIFGKSIDPQFLEIRTRHIKLTHLRNGLRTTDNDHLPRIPWYSSGIS